MPLTSTVTTVPNTEMPINAAVSGWKSTTIPNTPPKNAAVSGPQSAAPSTMGRSTKEMENGPK